MFYLVAQITFLLSIILNFCSAADHTGSNHDGNIGIRDEWQPNGSNQVCFFMTNDVNWQGEGQNLCQVGGRCSGLLPDGLASNVSSAGGNPGQTCFLNTAENCTGNSSAPINYPGYADLSAIGFLKKAVSWRCYKWCGYNGTASTTTTTTLHTMTKTTSAVTVNAVVVTHRDVSISTTLSGSQPTAQTGSTSSTVSISTTQSMSASSTASSTTTSSARASVLPPLSSPPAPISDSASSSAVSVFTTKSSSSTVLVSTTLTSGTSSTTPFTTTLPLTPPISLFSSPTFSSGIRTGNTSASSMSPSWIVLTHTFGGRGGSSTTLISVMLTGRAVPSTTVTPVSER